MIGGIAHRFQSTERSAGEALISVKGLALGSRVRSVDFVAKRGEVLALTGLLGSGQNEIARLIGGDFPADAGVIRVGDKVLHAASPHDAVAAGICLLTEDRKHEGILPNLPLRENIAVASLAKRASFSGAVRQADERRAAKDSADTFGVVASSLETPIRTLSGGNQQKALLARWHLADAEAFVLIEPTRGVDVGARADIYRRLDALARAGKAIILVSSDLAEVLLLADRILVVRDGAIAAEVNARDIDEERLNLLVQGAAP